MTELRLAIAEKQSVMHPCKGCFGIVLSANDNNNCTPFVFTNAAAKLLCANMCQVCGSIFVFEKTQKCTKKKKISDAGMKILKKYSFYLVSKFLLTSSTASK